MFAGQLNLLAPFDSAKVRAAAADFALNDENVDAFALVYSDVLGVCNDERAESGVFFSGLETDTDAGFPFPQVGRPSHFAVKSGLGSVRIPVAPMGNSKEDITGHPPQMAIHSVPAKQIETPAHPGEWCGSAVEKPLSAGVLDKSRLSDWMDAHALVHSSHHCAMYCRLGMEAAGLNTSDRPQSGDAGDYGPFLLRHGAQTVPQAAYSPQVGDVVVFDKTSEHPNGHIEMYDGHHWVSDFMQRTFSPYRDAASSPPYTIYRLA